MKRIAGVTLAVLCFAAPAAGGFGANTRVDHQDSTWWCCRFPDIAVFPCTPVPRVYVTFERDSPPGFPLRGDIMFSKSTDGGATWTGDDTVARGSLGRWGFSPQISTDELGRIYIVWNMDGRVWLSRSDSEGAEWSDPLRVSDKDHALNIGWARLRVRDSCVYVAWTDDRLMALNVMMAVSTDRGRSFGANRKVTYSMTDHYQADLCLDPVRPDHIYVALQTPYRIRPGEWGNHVELHRSTDGGASFTFRTVMDSTAENDGMPRLAADSHALYVLFTDGTTRVRASTDGGESFGPVYHVAPPDSALNSYGNGANLALDPFGNLHVCIMLNDLVKPYNVFYERSANGGRSFSVPEMVNRDTTAMDDEDSDIAVDDRGHAYLCWQHWDTDSRLSFAQVWFATNNPGVWLADHELDAPLSLGRPPLPSVAHGVLPLPADADDVTSCFSLLDPSGRKVMDLSPGLNDVSHLAPGVYFVRRASDRATAKVVLQR